MIKVSKCFWCKASDFKEVSERIDSVKVLECQKCHLLLVAEVPESLTDYYDEEDYFNPQGDTVTGYHENYDLISPFYLYWQGALIEEVARYGDKKTLLEVGCATGNALEMVRTFSDDIDLYGIDLSSYAIKVCQEKGLSASVSKINGFKHKSKFDIILSSETMEHVDELKEFIVGVKENLQKDGVYVFYVPAVEKDILIEQGKAYPSLTTSLEHVSYFTIDFLRNALKDAFSASVYVHQITVGDDNYALGIVSTNSALVKHMENYIKGFEAYDKNFSDPKTLYNLVVSSAKIANFDTANKYLENLQKTDIDKRKMDFLNGLIAYSKGELIRAREHFNSYLGESPANKFTLKILLSAEKEFNKLLDKDLEAKNKEIERFQKMQPKLVALQAEIDDLRQSKIVGSSIKLRKIVGKTLDPVRRFKKKT